jgi:hypothetical protein
MPWAVAAAAVAAGGSYLASQNSANASESAANTQLQATKEGQQLIREMYAKNAPYWEPYVGLGQQGTSAISALMPYLTHQFNASDLQTGLAPNYQFQLGQGLQAQRQSQNVGGGGSNISRAADIFSQNYAANAYQQAFANYDTQRKNIYSTLSGIANFGTQSAAGLSNLGSGTATNIANLIGQGAQASAAGQVGAANAWSGGITNASNNIANAGLLYSMQNRPQTTQQGADTQYPTQVPEGNYNYSLSGGFVPAR